MQTNNNTANNLPIGLFDSGVGGLTVLAELKKILPCENYLYLGDNARLPYGSKGEQTITRYALQATAALIARNIKMLVIACNTATAVALGALRSAYPNLPILGVIEPGARAACSASKTGNIAVIATASTVRGGAYQKAITSIRPSANVLTKACPLFVHAAEEGLVEGPVIESITQHYLAELFTKANAQNTSNTPDTLVLGCTHFPLLKNAITSTTGSGVTIVDSAKTTALEVKSLLKETGTQNSDAPSCSLPGKTTFLTTDDPKPFVVVGKLFLGENIKEKDVEHVDL